MRALTMIVLLLLVALTPGQCRPDSSTDENTLQHKKATSVSSGEMAPQVASQNAIRELIAPKPSALASSSARAAQFEDLEKAETRLPL